MIEEFDVNPSSIRADGNVISDQFKAGADYELVNYQRTNEVHNDFPANIANGGSDGTTDGWEAYLGASIDSVLLDAPIFGTNCIEVECPGTVINEGVRTDIVPVSPSVSHHVTMAVIGTPGSTLQMYLGEVSSEGSLIGVDGTGNIDMNGEPQIFDVQRTFGANPNLSVVICTDFEAQETSFQVLGGMLDRLGQPNSSWIPGEIIISDESVILAEAKSPKSDYIYGAFVEDTSIVQNNDLACYSNIESMGGTHVWYLDHYMQYDNATCKSQLEASLAEVANTKLKFHFCVLPFIKEGLEQYADPADLDYRSFFLSKIEDIITTFPQIVGISLNDYWYPDEYWDTSTPESRQQNRQTMIDFATAVRDLVHSHGLIFSINLIDPSSHDSYVEDLAPVCDLLMPEIYRGMGSCPVGVSLQAQHRWYASTLEEYISKSGDTPVLPSFITYDDHANPASPHFVEGEVEFSTEDIIRDVNIIFDHPECPGFVMCEYGYMPDDMYLPDGKSVDSKHQYSRRITTQGLIAGEGVIFPEGTLIADLKAKIPLNKVLNIYTDNTTYETIVGTGKYESFNDILDPADPLLKIVTESTSEFTWYTNIPHSGYILSDSLVQTVEADDSYPVGDTSIWTKTPGNVINEGIQEQPATVDVDVGDSIWHSMYLNGAGTFVLIAYERDKNSQIIRTNVSNPITLSATWQEIHLNTIIQSGVFCSFKVVTNSIQSHTLRINGVYINKGDAPRTGKNLAPDNVASTGGNGTTDGFQPQPHPGDGVISVEDISEGLKLSYTSGGT